MYRVLDENDAAFPGWYCRGSDITDLMSKAVRGQIDCKKPDAVLNIETHLFNVTLHASSCVYALDIGKELWLNRSRWSRLTKEYVPREPLDRFLDQCREILAGDARDGATANMMFRDPLRYEKKHRWGGCLMGATFRGNGKKGGKPCLTFYSRTTYMGYMALLDAAIASTMAAEIVERSRKFWLGKGDLTIDRIAFRWHISSQQMHCFKTLPYIYSKPDLMETLQAARKDLQDNSGKSLTPGWLYLAKWYNKVVSGWNEAKAKGHTPGHWLGQEKYGPFKRIKRRWLEYKRILDKNIPPSLFVPELSFDKCE